MQAIITRAQLYEMAEWAVTGLVLILGLKYLKQIISFVLMQLHQLIIQKGFLVM